MRLGSWQFFEMDTLKDDHWERKELTLIQTPIKSPGPIALMVWLTKESHSEGRQWELRFRLFKPKR